MFVTLTYDDDKLPPDGVSKRDVQLFLKRLRKRFDSRTLRYYICSEYGDHTFRPHYHAILFFNSIERSSDIYDTITEAWQNGFCQYGEVEEGSIVYVTKYCLKGSDVPDGKNANFRLLSKMSGGVGVDYIEEQFSYHLGKLDQPIYAHLEGKSAPMPRYYRTKIMKTLDPIDKEMIQTLYMENLNRLRKKAEDKLYKQFVAKFPQLKDDKHSFIIWKHEREDRQAELVAKHTKKQNIL